MGSAFGRPTAENKHNSSSTKMHGLVPTGGFDPIQSLETFQALRLWNLSLISKLMPQERQLRSVHPERGEMVLWTLVESMAGHDLHHFDKIACEEWGSHLSRRLLVE